MIGDLSHRSEAESWIGSARGSIGLLSSFTICSHKHLSGKLAEGIRKCRSPPFRHASKDSAKYTNTGSAIRLQF